MINKPISYYVKLSIGLLLGFILWFLLISLILWTNNVKIVCDERSTVKEIISIDYRSADILMENGEIVTVNQETLKPGDSYCYKTKRIYDD